MAPSALHVLLLPVVLAGAAQTRGRLLLELAANASRTGRGGAKTGTCAGTAEKVNVEFFVMSKCPDAEYCENLWLPVVQQLGDAVHVSFSYIASATDDEVICMHGQSECEGNRQRLCVQQYASSASQLLSFAQCQEKQRKSIPKNGEACAQEAGLDLESFRQCASGDEGLLLLKESAARSTELGASKSCTLHVQNQAFCVEDGGWKQCDACGSNKVSCLLEKVCCLLSAEKRAATAACQGVQDGMNTDGLLEISAWG